MTITVVEFSTALPYLGAVAILTNAGLTARSGCPCSPRTTSSS
jgi:hypothetical protein